MATIESIQASAEAWTLTLDESLLIPQAGGVPDDRVFAVNLSQETPESLERFQLKELSALALVMGARRSGKKSVIISSIIHRYQAREQLAAETVKSLSSRKVVELNTLLKKAGLPASYGNKQTKACLLIDWRDGMRAQAKRLLVRAKHFLSVSDAIADRRYHRAIAEGVMSMERAAAIITSAGLSLPVSLSPVNASEPVKHKGGRATRALEDGEIRAMFAQIEGRYAQRTRAMLMIGIHMALRASELCGLMVGDVSDGQHVRTYIPVRSEIAKGNKPRSIRIGDEVKRVIGDFLKWKGERGESLALFAPLFVSQKGGHLSRKQLFATVKDILLRAGIDQSPHCLRKTGATIYYEQSGYDLIATQVFLGHADPSVTRRYIGITPAQTAAYAQRSSQALISAVETGQSEAPTRRAHPPSRSDDDHQRMMAELERRGQTIDTLTAQVDRLTRLLESQDVEQPVEHLAQSGGTVISINALRRRRR